MFSITKASLSACIHTYYLLYTLAQVDCNPAVIDINCTKYNWGGDNDARVASNIHLSANS